MFPNNADNVEDEVSKMQRYILHASFAVGLRARNLYNGKYLFPLFCWKAAALELVNDGR